MLIVIVTWSAAALIVFCVAFFILCGCILLLDTIHLITMREKARSQISRIFFGTILAGLAAAVVFLISPETLADALDQAETERTRAVVAEAQTSGVIEEVRQQAVAVQLFERALESSEATNGDSASALATPGGRAPASAASVAAAAQNVVFIHTFEDSRAADARAMSVRLQRAGALAPGIDGLSIRVSEDQVRYFHPQSQAAAQAVADLVGINSVLFVDGFQTRVGTDHLEIWLKP